MAKERYEFIDLMKGICITLVVLHHCRIEAIENMQLLTTFRMPLYYILSGIFFKPYHSYKEFTFKKVNSLLIPILSTILLHNLLLNSFQVMSHSALRFRSLPPTMWFLISLFEVGTIYYIIKLCNNIIIETIICAALSITGYLLFVYQIHLPYYLDSALSAVLFYHYGSLLKRNHILPPKSQKHNILLMLISGSVFIGIGLLIPIEKLEMYNNIYPSNFIVTHLLAIAGTMFVLYLSKILNKLPLLSHLGRYSIIILCTHPIYIGILYKVNKMLNLPSSKVSDFIIIMALMFPTIYFINKYIPFLFAQQPMKDAIKSSYVYRKYKVATSRQ